MKLGQNSIKFVVIEAKVLPVIIELQSNSGLTAS